MCLIGLLEVGDMCSINNELLHSVCEKEFSWLIVFWFALLVTLQKMDLWQNLRITDLTGNVAIRYLLEKWYVLFF